MPLLRALNKNGELVSARDFPRGEFGRCEFCNAQVYHKTSPRGLDYMTLRDGQEHTHPICKRLVKRKTAYSLAEFDLDKLLNNISKPPTEHAARTSSEERTDPLPDQNTGIFSGKGFSADLSGAAIQDPATIYPGIDFVTGNPTGESLNPDQEAVSDTDYECKPCTRLSQMIDDDLLWELTPGMMINGKQAKNVFIIPRFLPEALNTKDFQKGGARVIDCCAYRFHDDHNSIHFRVNKQVNGQWIHATFVIYFGEGQKDLLYQYAAKFFNREKRENGTLGWRPIKNKRALIAANWTRSKNKSRNQEGPVFYTKYLGEKQIYLYEKTPY